MFPNTSLLILLDEHKNKHNCDKKNGKVIDKYTHNEILCQQKL